jgi:hypothetical protein
MNYTYEIRRQAETAPRAALPAVASALWKAFGEGHLSEAEAEALSGLIEARQLTERPTELHQRSTDTPRKAVGSRPRNGCLDGPPSPLGSLWEASTGYRCLVYPGGAGGAGCYHGGGREAGGLPSSPGSPSRISGCEPCDRPQRDLTSHGARLRDR